MRMWAVMMNLPDGKLPGFYAQIVKALAAESELFDRDKEILIVDDQRKLPPVENIMQRYKIDYELAQILHLPSDTRRMPVFDDFGFVSRMERLYVFEDQCAVFTLKDADIESNGSEMAALQLCKHLVAEFTDRNGVHYVIERHLAELAERVASAYGCTAAFE